MFKASNKNSITHFVKIRIDNKKIRIDNNKNLLALISSAWQCPLNMLTEVLWEQGSFGFVGHINLRLL